MSGVELYLHSHIRYCGMHTGIFRLYFIIGEGKVCVVPLLNPLKTNVRPLYLKAQFVPRCKHSSSRL